VLLFVFVLSTLLAVRCVVRCCVLLCIASAVSRDSRPARGPGEGGARADRRKRRKGVAGKKWGFVFCGGLLIGQNLLLIGKTSFKTVA